VCRDAPLAPPPAGGAGGGQPGRGWARQGALDEDRAELERKASIAARFRHCHELLWQTRWREMRDGLAQMVDEQGELGVSACLLVFVYLSSCCSCREHESTVIHES